MKSVLCRTRTVLHGRGKSAGTVLRARVRLFSTTSDDDKLKSIYSNAPKDADKRGDGKPQQQQGQRVEKKKLSPLQELEVSAKDRNRPKLPPPKMFPKPVHELLELDPDAIRPKNVKLPSYPDIYPAEIKDEDLRLDILEQRLEEFLPQWERLWKELSAKKVDRLQRDLDLEDKPIDPKKVSRPPPVIEYTRQVDENGVARGKGGRKNSTAFVFLKEGDGNFTVNGKHLSKYFPILEHRYHCLEPLVSTKLAGKVDVDCLVKSGGHTGQSGAIRHGLARALQNFNPELRKIMKPLKYLTRDARVVERKKAGQKKARKKHQWVKR